MTPAACAALRDLAVALGRLAEVLGDDGGPNGGGDDLLPLREAARVAATSPRVIRDAIRAGFLPAFGGQRDRAVRRADLMVWITSRRVRVKGPADGDIARRVTRLAREGVR